MLINLCDICGKQTFINPKTEPEYIYDEEGNIKDYKKAKILRQNPSTGDLEEVEIPSFKDLEERTYKITLIIGNESITKDFCKECLKTSGLLEQSKKLFFDLAKIKSK